MCLNKLGCNSGFKRKQCGNLEALVGSWDAEREKQSTQMVKDCKGSK
jgi:hypothetical protein